MKNKGISHISVSLLILVFISCATLKNPAPRYAHIENIPPDDASYVYEIGSPIVRKVRCSKKNAVNIKETFTWNSESYPAQVAVHSLTDKSYDFYGPLEGPVQFVGVYLGIKRNENKAVLLWNNTNFPLKKVPTIDYTEIIDRNSDYFEQELIFNGRVGDQVKFLYREFTNNSIRGSFTQNVQYDLNSSSEIGFKGARIVVEEATNKKITCRVKSTFNEF